MTAQISDTELDEIAAACHAGTWFLQLSDGATSTPSPCFAETPEWAQESTRDSVRAVLAGVTPEQLWQHWAEAKRLAGWKYGEVKDPVAKTHPCLVDNYAQLSAYEHYKDRVFTGLVQIYTRMQAARRGKAS
jgi:hypothetical protein